MNPALFIGSSAENLDVAYALQENLEHELEVTVWTQGIFDLTKSTLETLCERMTDFHFAAFIFAPDDLVRMRHRDHVAVRDNVVFELGMFIGNIGRLRTFIVVPSGVEALRLPSDLLGITPSTYEPQRRDGNLLAALGPTANRIRRAAKAHGVCLPPTPDSVSPIHVDYDENDLISILESWMGSRMRDENTRLISYADVDSELGLPNGTCEKYIPKAAVKFGYVPARKGKKTIVFERADPPF